MPIVSGSINTHGAVVDVLVGVSANRRAALLRASLPVPTDVPLRLQVDTGSFACAFPAAVFAALQLTPYRTIPGPHPRRRDSRTWPTSTTSA